MLTLSAKWVRFLKEICLKIIYKKKYIIKLSKNPNVKEENDRS